ncbi:MAG: membrane protein insertase YidC [Pseudomonadota bacterium]|nr:membrane protein insertase YidC [Pseudomonadota bacterium]
MDNNNTNFLVAIVLSLAVLVAWQVFLAPEHKKPTPEQQRAQQQQAQQQQQQISPGAASDIPRPEAAPGATVPSVDGQPSGLPVVLNRTQALKSSPRIAIKTPSLEGSLALKGGRIDDIILKKYRVSVEPGSDNVVLFSPAGTVAPFYAEHGWVAASGQSVKVPDATSEWKQEGSGALSPGSPVTLVWDNGEGLIFRRLITVDENYLFTVRQEVRNDTGGPVSLYPFALISRHGKPKIESFYILHEGLVGVIGEKGLQEIDYDDISEDKLATFSDAKGGWLGITDKYWAAVVVPDQKTNYQARFSSAPMDKRDRYQTDYLLSPVTVAPGGSAAVEGHLFAGAKETQLVDGYSEKYGIQKFDLLIDWGWFYFLTKPMFYALDFMFKLLGNFGLAILGVTVLIKLILFPLANKSYVSMSKMKKLQPEMQRIKDRFANDRARQQQAMMDLYKKEKVNPASGCLPILIQIPVFFALYKVLFVTIEMRQAPFYGWIRDLSAPDPTSLFNLFGLIPWSPPHFLMIGVWPLVMGITMWVQMQLNPPPPDPVQAKIFKWMPLFFTFLLAPFPAGLVIYWAWNNFLSIIQQWFIMSRQGVEIHLLDNIGLNKNKKRRPAEENK